MRRDAARETAAPETSARPGGRRPATEWIRVTSSASARVSAGRIPGKRRASIVLPVPGGPISKTLCEPAAAISSARRARSCPRTSARSGASGLVGVLRQGLVRRGLDLSAEVRDDLGEVAHGHRLDARERSLGRRLGRADDSRETGTPRSFGDGERARHRANPPVEAELADGGVVGEPLRRKLPGRTEHGERDRKVESRSFLAQCGRGEIDGDPPIERPVERGRDDAAANAVLRLLAGAVGETDDREARDPRLEMRLDVDLPRLEADERMSDRASEHPRHGRHWGRPNGQAPVPISLRECYEDGV